MKTRDMDVELMLKIASNFFREKSSRVNQDNLIFKIALQVGL